MLGLSMLGSIDAIPGIVAISSKFISVLIDFYTVHNFWNSTAPGKSEEHNFRNYKETKRQNISNNRTCDKLGCKMQNHWHGI